MDTGKTKCLCQNGNQHKNKPSNSPNTARHQEKVDDHKQYRAAPIVQKPLPNCPLLDQVRPAGGGLLVARDLVAHAKADDKSDRDHGEAGREVDDRTFRICKSKFL